MKFVSRALLGALLLFAVPAFADDISNGSYSTTDGGNNAAPPNGWPAGMFPNQVEPSARANMGATARWWERANAKLTTTGSAGAYVITPSNPTYPTAYTQGEIYCAKANFTSVGSDTINVNALGAKSLYINNGSALAQLPAGAIFSGQQFCATYDGALGAGAGGFQLISAFSPAGYLKAANNLSDLANAATSRTSLGLGSSSTRNATNSGLNNVLSFNSGTPGYLLLYDTSAATDSGIYAPNVMLKSNNLSDVVPATARANLGLGVSATRGVTNGGLSDVLSFGSGTAGNLVAYNSSSATDSGLYVPNVMVKSDNLSGISSASTSRSNLGLTNGATTTITASTSGPSGSANNGDIWIQY